MVTDEGLRGFIESILKYRDSHNMTQEQFAEHVGYSASAVKRWETGISGPKTKELINIADKMGLTVDELLRGIQPKNVSIHNETGLSDETIDLLRDRDSISSFYLRSIIEPLIQNKALAFDIIAMAQKKRKDGDSETEYTIQGIRWSLLETFAKLIDKGSDELAYTGSEDKFLNDLIKNERMLSVYRDFGGILQEESEDKQE